MQIAIRKPHPLTISADSSVDDLVEWSLNRFSEQRVAITTGFGMEGCALIDLYNRHGASLDVVYLDTGFLFQETHELIARMKRRYPGFRFENRGTALSASEQARIFGDRLWEKNPDLCCRLRKVDPMRAALDGLDVWITGLRRDQSPTRTTLKVIEWSWRYSLLKISPLARWSRREVWEYVRSRDVPFNPLHKRGYPSIGCTHCTRPVSGSTPSDYSRDGRWSTTGKTECGLHA